jgi:hypothetical protein
MYIDNQAINNKGEPHMLKTIVSYTRYTLALLATVGFGVTWN